MFNCFQGLSLVSWLLLFGPLLQRSPVFSQTTKGDSRLLRFRFNLDAARELSHGLDRFSTDGKEKRRGKQPMVQVQGKFRYRGPADPYSSKVQRQPQNKDKKMRRLKTKTKTALDNVHKQENLLANATGLKEMTERVPRVISAHLEVEEPLRNENRYRAKKNKIFKKKNREVDLGHRYAIRWNKDTIRHAKKRADSLKENYSSILKNLE